MASRGLKQDEYGCENSAGGTVRLRYGTVFLHLFVASMRSLYFFSMQGRRRILRKIKPGCMMKSGDKTLLESNALEDNYEKIGSSLRAARLDTGRSVADVASELRIPRDYIKALEAGDFAALPGATYISGYIRSYANLVGLDTQVLVGRYQAVRGSDGDKPKYNFPTEKPRTERSGAVVASLAVILGLAGYAGWYWSGKPGIDEATSTAEVATAEVAEVVSPAEPLVSLDDSGPALSQPGKIIATSETANFEMSTGTNAVVVEEDAVDALPVITESSETVASINSETTAPIAPVALPADDTSAVSTKTVAATASDAGSNAVNSAPLAPLAPVMDSGDRVPDGGSAIATSRDPAVEITLRATASSWVEIVRSDGEEVMTKLMRDGDTYLIDGGANLYMSTGNAGGLEFVFPDGAILPAGDVGEILRDLPLKADGLLASL